MKQVDQGILIHRINYSENSLIITLFTSSNGVQKFISKGVKKKPGNLFPMGIYEIDYYKKPTAELGSITNIVQIKHHFGISNSPIKQIISFFIADLLKQTQKSESKDDNTFNFITNAIQKLDNTNNVSCFLCVFILEYIDTLGITPYIEEENSNCFDLEKGVFTSNKTDSDNKIMNKSVESIIDYYKNNKLNPKSNFKEVLNICLRYLSYHIPNFNMEKSIDIIREILYD
ncbi:MAG: DNA repair protein RecO [Flavobacteriales bacterium]|nr:DNA repair protein RecO [Flavobacteriales bacterium]